jgi:hypothetical protein
MSGSFFLKPDLPAGRFRRWGHELAESLKDHFKIVSVLLKATFQGIDLAGKFRDGERHFTQAHESPHDGDVDRHGPGLWRTLESMAPPSWVKT